ncbi:hypothetical protein K1719_010929 [Acacia pycnantha]|nr:hypothetical protein K1719_010929 [Acacia pycnantha]
MGDGLARERVTRMDLIGSWELLSLDVFPGRWISLNGKFVLLSWKLWEVKGCETITTTFRAEERQAKTYRVSSGLRRRGVAGLFLALNPCARFVLDITNIFIRFADKLHHEPASISPVHVAFS